MRKIFYKKIEKGLPRQCFYNVATSSILAKSPVFTNENDAIAVHGKVRTSVMPKTIHHAWIEKGRDVIDPTFGIMCAKWFYYEMFNAEPELTYSP